MLLLIQENVIDLGDIGGGDDAVFVDVGFGRDDGLVGAGLVNVHDGFARRLENRLAPGGQRKGAKREGEENLFHFVQIGYQNASYKLFRRFGDNDILSLAELLL